MQTQATVIFAKDQTAKIQINRKAACDGCHKATDEKGCSVCTLMGGDATFVAEADNSIGAAEGDIVLVETGTGRVLLYAMLVFLLPIVTAIAFWAVAVFVTEQVYLQLIAAAIGFIICFVGVWFYSEHIKKKTQDIVIVSILQAHTQISNE